MSMMTQKQTTLFFSSLWNAKPPKLSNIFFLVYTLSNSNISQLQFVIAILNLLSWENSLSDSFYSKS